MTGKSAPETAMNDDAFDLLNTYYDGIDDAVRALAVQCAISRDSYLPNDPSVVLVEKEDVVAAGQSIGAWVKQLVKKKKINPESLSRISKSVEGLELELKNTATQG